MKKIFALTMIIGFIWALPVMAWQDPCETVGQTYTYEEFELSSWVPSGPGFSPAPECEGIVTLWNPDGDGERFGYIGNNGVLTIGGILLCQVSNAGDLVCKIVTKPAIPEESTVVILNGQ